MKILFITNGYPPLHRAGTETYTAGIATEFAQRGHQVQVLCVGDLSVGPQPVNGLETQVHHGVTVTRGVTISRLNLNWTAGPDPNRALYLNPEVEPYLRSLLKSFRPDLVHITSCYTLSASVVQTVKALGLPLVITLTDFWFICPRVILLKGDGTLCDGQTTAWTCLECMLMDSRLYQRRFESLPKSLSQPILTAVSEEPLLSRQRGFRGLALNMADRKTVLPALLSQADLLLSPSKFLANTYQAAGLQKPIQVLEHGHDLEWVPPQRRPARSGSLVFGYIGRLTSSKGVHVFTSAIDNLNRAGGFTAQIWGDPDQEPEYAQRLAATYKPTTPLSFKGKFSRAELASVYSGLDVLVVPSIWYENSPLVIQEAFAAGVPVVASNLGGMAEFVKHEVSGLLFKAGDADDLARTLRRLIDEPNLLTHLRQGLPPVKSITTEADDLLAHYVALPEPHAA